MNKYNQILGVDISKDVLMFMEVKAVMINVKMVHQDLNRY